MKQFFNLAGPLMTMVHLSGALPVLGQLPGGPAPAADPSVDGPRIRISEMLFDFGKIKSSEPVRHEYIVTNTGNAVLDILAVQPGCPGCTAALPWDRQIEPGKTGRIPIQFNPFGFNGTVTKSVTVSCNDPTQPTHILQFKAHVWQPIDVQPTYLYFMPVEGEETNDTKVVRLISNLDEPLSLDPPKCDNPSFKLELKTVQPGKEFALHVSYAGPFTNPGPQGQITIGTSSSNAPAIKISSRVMPQPALVVSPLQIMLPAGPLSAGHRHTQMIRNNSATPVKITEAAVNAEGVAVQISESQPGKLFLLNLNFPTNFQSRAGEPLALTVKTTHPKRPLVNVPIVQARAPGPAAFRPPAAAPPASR